MIYIIHDNDHDGRIGAWVVEKWCKNKRLDYNLICSNDRNKLDLTPQSNDRVMIVDLAFTEEICDRLYSLCPIFTVIDHHKSSEWLQNKPYGKWNDKLSGCELAWEYFFDRDPAPPIVKYVGDRDLWEFELPHSKAINTFLSSCNLDSYEQINGINYLLENNIYAANSQGQTILDYLNFKRLEKIKTTINERKFNVFFDNGFSIPIFNLTGDISDTLHTFLEELKAPVVASYFIKQDKQVVVSLRGQDKLDCSEIAKLYGGGGHFNAAGFVIPYTEFFNRIR